MSTRIKLLLVLCTVFVASIAIGSNMGFKLNYSLVTNAAGNNINWISIPYFDNYTTDETLCTDVNTDCPGAATSVSFFDTANNAFSTHGCGYTSDFNILTTRSYGIAVGSTCTWRIVGSHDDSYDTTNGVQFSTNAAGNNINWISVPYHITVTTDEALCTSINTGCSGIATSISFFDTANNAFSTHGCGYTSDFSLVAGRGYGVAVSGACAAPGWHPPHY